jgi:hypothetical protein
MTTPLIKRGEKSLATQMVQNHEGRTMKIPHWMQPGLIGLTAIWLAMPAHAQSGYTVNALDGVFATTASFAEVLDNTNRVLGNRSRWSLKGPQFSISPFGGNVARSAYWPASTAAKVSPTSLFSLATEWSTQVVSDNGQWQGLISTSTYYFGRSQGTKVMSMTSAQGMTPSHVIRDINNSGEMVGHTGVQVGQEPPVDRPYLWRNGVIQPMNFDGAVGGRAAAINNLGDVAGTLLFPALPGNFASERIARAAKWQNGVVTWLADTATFGNNSDVVAMNDAGDMVVVSDNGIYRSFVVTAAGEVTPLSPQRGFVQARDINASGVVVGEADGRVVFWVNGVEVDLAAHLAAKGVSSVSTWRLLSLLDINDKGSMVVRYRLPSDAAGSSRKARLTAKP